MRPVDKGSPPRSFTSYRQARHDLAERIGYYCSYCEMSVYNSIEVEHIIPMAKAGAELDWDNFLLSCKYCNTIKSDHFDHITDYLWPDRDNTDLAFEYNKAQVVSPAGGLNEKLSHIAKSTIRLTGLDRNPAGPAMPTASDTRWRSRKDAWEKARISYDNWRRAPGPPMAKVIAQCSLSGHYSIWQTVFKGEQQVLDEIDKVYRSKNLFKVFLPNGGRAVRPLGLL